jgi:hypothetical protein
MGETVAAVEAKKGIARRLERCRQELDMERKRLSELQAIMDREEEDVARLEGLGLANLFYTILGDKPAKVDKERQEFLIAKLRRDEAAASVKALQNDIEALASELAKAGRPEDDLRKLMEAKGRLLRERGGPQAEALLELDEKKGRLEAERKEILEALEAGRKVLAGLEEVLRSLESAQGWGVWDMIGGGLLATAAKHSIPGQGPGSGARSPVFDAKVPAGACRYRQLHRGREYRRVRAVRRLLLRWAVCRLDGPVQDKYQRRPDQESSSPG